MNNTLLAERLNVQPLTEEEKQQRHILGRLFGPIATCLESTRNGRKYNRALWERALADEIFKEKLSNKCLFLELGHPVDREEIDMTKVCACIPEMPKIIDGDLCATVDILDTPNGKILKTLCDYGFVPGISSRGSGDVMDNNEVDPETFFLECFDIVGIPAVKKARLNICESLDSNGVKLRKALAESYKSAKEEDKDTMKKALENLNIDIDKELAETVEEPKAATEKLLTADDIPWDPEAEEVLVEEAEDATDAEPAEEEPELDAEETNEEPDAADDDNEDTSDNELDQKTVSAVIKLLQEYDDMRIEFAPIEIDGNTYEVEAVEYSVDDNDKNDPILVIGVNCEPTEEQSEIADKDIEFEIEDDKISKENIEVDVDNTNSADDAGDDGVIESLKEMIRQKETLEAEVNDLRKAKAVGDAKEQELQEKLTRYRRAFKQTSAEAAKVPELQSKVDNLTEQLTQTKNTIKTLTEKVNNTQQLKESMAGSERKVQHLNEAVSKLTEKSEALEAKLEGQTKQYTQKLQERTNLAKAYKARFLETLTKYVESKAHMLGVKPSEITSRLNENYTLADVDAVCDQILDTTVNFSRLPFGGRAVTSARITESVSRVTRTEPEYGYDIDDSLLELAGLKR